MCTLLVTLTVPCPVSDGEFVQYFPVPPQFLQDWQESCRNPEDSAKLAELGRTGTEFSRISAKLEYIFKL